MARTPTPAPRRPDHIEDIADDEAVDLSPDMAAALAEEERKAAATADDDDDDDFDLLGDDDDDDDIGSDDSDADEDGDEDGDDDSDGDDDEDKPSLTRVPRVARKGKGEEPTKSKAQLRIEELAAKRRDAEAEAFKAEMALQEERRARQALEERIAALESGKGVTPKPAKPDPTKFKYGEVDPDYIDAMVEHRLAEERDKFQATQAEDAAKAENAKKAEFYKKRLAEVAAKGKARFGDKFSAIVDKTDFPGKVAVDILDSDYGVDIAYYLGKNISKLREISFMSDAERARAFGRLEERFAARASAGKKRSKAPETPGRKPTRKPEFDPKYGPDDQDEFDRAFSGR